ncbi:sodium:solute symporter family protein [Pseudoflavonifractor phocaeensis]|uniref:sodium:solute symporter family protein n=1 Tax=Pseudoflavonifractor phocaeensis TaxID=1870988 RepID=UPI002109F290|nr:sodium:solute symporter family protein [Pseudoflavonifractor phocaeensis]MCQ4864262.1 sodium:solute symporter family protein [Pseudoflavonifractor phocaeensis]
MLSASTIWIAFGVYMVFLLGVAVFVTQKEKRQKVGGSLLTASVPWPVLVMTYIASLMSTWVFFAGPGAYYRGGLGYWISELSYIALFPIIAHFTMNKVWIVNKQRKGAFTTPADFYYDRFKSPVLRTILGIIFLAASFPYISSVLVAIAQAAQYATDGAINYRMAVIVVGLIMTVFVCVGGVKSAAMADTVQGLLFILMLWVIVIACLIVGFGGSLNLALDNLWEHTQSFFSYPGPSGWTPYAGRFGYPFSCAIGWTIMLPHVFVRSGYFGDNLKAQRKLSFLTPVLQAVVWTGTMMIGLIGLALVNNLAASESELIIPYMIKNFVLNFNPVLAKVLMVGFFVGASAVGLSTANAFLSVSSAIVSSDLIKNTFHINVPKSKETLVNRIIIAVLGLGSLLLAIDPPDLIFTLIMFSIAIVMPLFPILVAGLYWKKATKQAAIVSAIVGTVLVLLTYFVWNIGGTWYGAIGMLGSTITMVVVSLFTKQPESDAAPFYEALESGMKRYYVVKDKKSAKAAAKAGE